MNWPAAIACAVAVSVSPANGRSPWKLSHAVTQNANTSVWASIASPSHRELTGAFVREGTAKTG